MIDSMDEFASIRRTIRHRIRRRTGGNEPLFEFVADGLTSVAQACLATMTSPEILSPMHVELLLQRAPFGRSWLHCLSNAFEVVALGDKRLNIALVVSLKMAEFWIGRLESEGRLAAVPAELWLPDTVRH